MDKQMSSRVGSDTIKLTASKIATTIISLVSSMLLSRFRTLTEYGTYSQLLMAINLVCSALMLGLPNSLNYFAAKAESQEERDKFLSVYYTLSTILSLITGLVLVLSTPLLEKIFDNNLISKFWYFLAFFPWTKIIMSGVENLLVVYQKTHILMLYRILNSIALLGIIVLVQVLNGSFSSYMILYLVVEASFTIWVYVLVKKNAQELQPSLNLNLLKSVLTFSIPLGIASMVGTINIELDKLVITSFFSTEELAVYTNASKELPVTVIATSLTAVLLPQMVRLLKEDKPQEAVKLWNSATTISFGIICYIAMGCVVFAPEVIQVLYSDKYLSGTTVFRIYSLGLLLKCTYFGMLLNATGRTKFIFFSSLGSLALNFVLNYICYFLMGFIGPAVATLISSLLMQTFQLIYTSKVCKVPFKNIFPWKNILCLFLLNCCLGGGFYIIQNFAIKYINQIVSAIILGVVWGGVLLLILFKPLKKQWGFLNKKPLN